MVADGGREDLRLEQPEQLTALRLTAPFHGVYSVTMCGLYSQGRNDAKSVHGDREREDPKPPD